jgi:hypothetical protein
MRSALFLLTFSIALTLPLRAAGGFANPFFAFDNGTGRDQKVPPEDQAELLKRTGYAGLGFSGAQGVPEMLKALESQQLSPMSLAITQATLAEVLTYLPQVRGTGLEAATLEAAVPAATNAPPPSGAAHTTMGEVAAPLSNTNEVVSPTIRSDKMDAFHDRTYDTLNVQTKRFDQRFVADPAKAEPVQVRFDLAAGPSVTRPLRPDSADCFSVPLPASER